MGHYFEAGEESHVVLVRSMISLLGVGVYSSSDCCFLFLLMFLVPYSIVHFHGESSVGQGCIWGTFYGAGFSKIVMTGSCW